MLNTKNRFESALIWIVTLLLIATVAWDLMGFEPFPDAWSHFLASDTAREFERFQWLLGTLGGFGLLALVYWLNAQKDRKAVAAQEDRWARNIGHALQMEIAELGEDSDQRASHILKTLQRQEHVPAAQAETPEALIARSNIRASRPNIELIMSLTPAELTRLGRNTHAAIKHLRSSLRQIDSRLFDLSTTGASSAQARQLLSDLARDCSALGLCCNSVRSLIGTLANHGVEVADERDAPSVPTAADVEAHVKSLGQSITAPREKADNVSPHPAMRTT